MSSHLYLFQRESYYLILFLQWLLLSLVYFNIFLFGHGLHSICLWYDTFLLFYASFTWRLLNYMDLWYSWVLMVSSRERVKKHSINNLAWELGEREGTDLFFSNGGGPYIFSQNPGILISWHHVVAPHWLGTIRTSDSAYCQNLNQHPLIASHWLGMIRTSDWPIARPSSSISWLSLID